jgi:hypothetical protein
MVISNYTYLMLKMFGPKGVITINSNFEQVYFYEQDCIAQVTALVASCAPVGSGHNIEGALTEGASKMEVMLVQPSICEEVETFAPPSRRMI